MCGAQSHSTLPLGATNADVSQSDRKAYSAIGGKSEVRCRSELSGASRVVRHDWMGSQGWDWPFVACVTSGVQVDNKDSRGLVTLYVRASRRAHISRAPLVNLDTVVLRLGRDAGVDDP